MSVKAKVTPNNQNRKRMATRLELGAAEIATDILRRAKFLAPKKDRHLVNSGTMKRITPQHYRIRFNSFGSVPYARIHELGGMTGRGYKTKIVAKHYLENAADSVILSDTTKYFRQGR